MQERSAGAVDLASLVWEARTARPREAVRSLTTAVLEACRGNLRDDATVVILDWLGLRPEDR